MGLADLLKRIVSMRFGYAYITTQMLLCCPCYLYSVPRGPAKYRKKAEENRQLKPFARAVAAAPAAMRFVFIGHFPTCTPCQRRTGRVRLHGERHLINHYRDT